MTTLQPYVAEFISLAFVHLLAVASPGPDLAIVMRYSIHYGRKAAVYCSIGIGLGILLHVAYSLLGIGLLIKASPMLFNGLLWCAALYLMYIGVSALKAKPNNAQQQIDGEGRLPQISNKKAFVVGFITNGLNPKATLFFLSVFSVVVSMNTPNEVKAVYGTYLSLATMAWFCFLSFILGTAKIRNAILAKGYWFDRLMGVVLIGLAIHLVWESVR